MERTTSSPILNIDRIKSFFHRGQFVAHEGKNKDLALVKYCSTGLMDQDKKYHFVLDDLRHKQHLNGDATIASAESTATIFVTSDSAQDMRLAIENVKQFRKNLRTSFVTLQLPKVQGRGEARMTTAGEVIGFEMRKRFVRQEHDALLMELEE